MTLVNTETGELVDHMTRAEAEDFVRFMRVAQEQIPRRIIDAYHRRAWIPLGYASWEVMIAAEGLAIRLPRDERQEMVLAYSAAGLSTRAIAPVLDIDQKTVVNDRRAGEEISSPALPAPASPPLGEDGDDAGQTPDGQDDGEATRPEPADAPEPARPVAPVIGIDGKKYARPDSAAAPKQPASRRRPLPDVARDAGWDLRKSVERIERTVTDDRFGANKDVVAAQLRSHLTHAIEVCQDVLDRINREES